MLVAMARFLFAFILLAFGLPPAGAADYTGKVGKLEAVFSLDWHEDGSVSGVYRYPSRPGTSYSLQGSNPSEGELHLEEYSDGVLTARCHLRKSVTNGVILWRGEMRNTDGRRFPMELARTQAAAPPAPAPATGETRYTGYVGRLDAAFLLAWEDDGSVRGSYHYPQRPDTSYTLRGANPKEGELHLAEYTGERLTARCLLRKRLEHGTIVWEGMMTNTDGRRFPMAFARAREDQPAAGLMEDYEAKRRTFLARIETEPVWSTFPLADEVVDFVPVGLDEGEYFGAKVEDFRVAPGATELILLVADWDVEGHLRLDQGKRLVLRATRELPLPAQRMVGCEIAAAFDGDGSLASLELADIAVSHVRRAVSGKFEVRGPLDFYEKRERPEFGSEADFAERRAAPIASLVPDKLALSLVPEEVSPHGGEAVFQTIRLVREYGVVIQATAAGPGSVELETLSLDVEAEADPWISLQDLKEPVKAPPSQFTGEAG